jgi:glyoxylase-like metal-dependent hydrolase (beta-lactamase superfamily II)
MENTMKIIPIGPISVFSTKCYLVVNENNNAVLVDAPDEAEYIVDVADKNNCNIKKILLTHGHCDHIGAAAQIQ